jgi:hypothetical protein
MYNSSDEEDGCEATTKPNAFEVLMQPPSKKAKVVDKVDPIVIAVIYIRWLKWIDPSEPLYGCPYVGQSMRIGNLKEEVAAKRWGQENSSAKSLNKRVGLMHELKVHGPEAFHNEIVDWKKGPRSEMHAWLNEREFALISEHGGKLRDPSVRCKQTLNLTKGGRGHCSFEAIDASRTVAWLHFQDEMQEYVECHDTSLVSNSYVNPVSGYKLGARLSGVRQGELWKGHPEEIARKEWLESLPHWAWNAMKTEEHRDKRSECAKAQWANADEEKRAEWIRRLSEAHSTPEYTAAASERAKKQSESQEARKELSERGKAQAVREAAEGKMPLAERGNATRTENWTKEQHEAATIKLVATMANYTPKKRDAISAKKTATAAAKRADVLAALPESKRPKKQAEFDLNDRKEAARKAKANALLLLPLYTNKDYQWCYRNLSQAQNDGVVFSQDSKGVWCARMRKQGGQCVGSSAERARTGGVEATGVGAEQASEGADWEEKAEAEAAEAPRVVERGGGARGAAVQAGLVRKVEVVAVVAAAGEMAGTN